MQVNYRRNNDDGWRCCKMRLQKANQGVTFDDGGRVCVGLARWAIVTMFEEASMRDWLPSRITLVMQMDNQASIKQSESEDSMSSVKHVNVFM